nr:GNAT family N-acetyltransferase [Anaerolineae bacterium]
HIDPPYHGKGIGTLAMQFIETMHPATKWSLDTPIYATRNQHFYEKLGYIKVGETIEAGGLVLFSYEKVIS